MKISDFIFRYPTCCGTHNDAICRVRIFSNLKYELFVLLTDLGRHNTGSSVTNSIETIVENLILRGHINDNFIIIEHYENFIDTFDFVQLNNNVPEWRSTTLEKIHNVIECDLNEFKNPTSKIKRLLSQIEKIKHDIDPYVDEPYREDYEVINRRDDILQNMISKKDLEVLVEANEKEQEIQALIKTDLSIIADVYTTLKEEYICFSEFPVGNGFVDFVMFSGRSKMEVTLIEIKGANYSFLNKNSYNDFSAKTNQAIQQIQKRLGYISRNYYEFKEFVHQIRDEVENGNTKYNSFVGPKGKRLEVSAEKDIEIHTVVIGGRSNNDLLESELKYNYEQRQSPPFKLETWDSWLNIVER